MKFCCGFHPANIGFVCFFFNLSVFGLVVACFAHRRILSLNGRLSLFIVKLWSAQKLMIGYNISIIQFSWVHQIHVITHVFVSNIVGDSMQKSQLLSKYRTASNYRTASEVVSNNLRYYLVKRNNANVTNCVISTKLFF